MKIIVGLGNPGKQYEGTRHNAGVRLVDAIYNLQFTIFNEFSNHSFQWETKNGIEVVRFDDLVLVKSKDYFMNESAQILEDLKDTRHKIQDTNNLYVAHDDLDLKLGEYKIQFGKGPGVHGGINDIERVIGKDFWRIRIGIDNRGVPRMPGEEYVLQKFSDEETSKIQSVVNEIVKGFVG